MISQADEVKYLAGIKRTGFELEHKVAMAFKRKGWSVVSNKHYLDDVDEKAREIDLLVYKVESAAHFRVFTSLLVSCKASVDRVWALLARDPDLTNPDYNWEPLHAWTNDAALGYEIELRDAGKRHQAAVTAAGVKEVLSVPSREVFAFQELNGTTGAPSEMDAPRPCDRGAVLHFNIPAGTAPSGAATSMLSSTFWHEYFRNQFYQYTTRNPVPHLDTWEATGHPVLEKPSDTDPLGTCTSFSGSRHRSNVRTFGRSFESRTLPRRSLGATSITGGRWPRSAQLALALAGANNHT